MKKFIIALCAVMLLMLSCAALAEGLIVYGYEITDGETWYFNDDGDEVGSNDQWTTKVTAGDSAVITLRNCDIEIIGLSPQSMYLSEFPAFVTAEEMNVELVLEGNNTISVPDEIVEEDYSYGNSYHVPVFAVDGEMTVSGSGSLDIIHEQAINAGEFPYGPIIVTGTLTMESGDVYVENKAYEEDAFATGVTASKIHMQGGKLETYAYSEMGEAFGAFVVEETTVEGGSLICNAEGYYVWMEEGEYIAESVGDGLRQLSGDINVSGGQLSGEGNYNGIYLMHYGDINVSGGEMYGEGDNAGVCVIGGDINVSGGEMYGEGDYAGVYVIGGNINATGGKIEGYSRNEGFGIMAESESEEYETVLLYSNTDDVRGGYINADGMDIWNAEGDKWVPGKIGLYEVGEGDYRDSSIYAMDMDPNADWPLFHSAITAPIPETGDAANLILWAGMIVLAGAALIMMKKRSFN